MPNGGSVIWATPFTPAPNGSCLVMGTFAGSLGDESTGASQEGIAMSQAGVNSIAETTLSDLPYQSAFGEVSAQTIITVTANQATTLGCWFSNWEDGQQGNCMLTWVCF